MGRAIEYKTEGELVFDRIVTNQWVANASGWGWDYIPEVRVTGTVYNMRRIPEGHC